MEARGLLTEALWPLNVHSQIFRISLQISGLLEGVEVLRGLCIPGEGRGKMVFSNRAWSSWTVHEYFSPRER